MERYMRFSFFALLSSEALFGVFSLQFACSRSGSSGMAAAAGLRRWLRRGFFGRIPALGTRRGASERSFSFGVFMPLPFVFSAISWGWSFPMAGRGSCGRPAPWACGSADKEAAGFPRIRLPSFPRSGTPAWRRVACERKRASFSPWDA